MADLLPSIESDDEESNNNIGKNNNESDDDNESDTEKMMDDDEMDQSFEFGGILVRFSLFLVFLGGDSGRVVAYY